MLEQRIKSEMIEFIIRPLFIPLTLFFCSCSNKHSSESQNNDVRQDDEVVAYSDSSDELKDASVFLKSHFFSKKNNPNNLRVLVYKIDTSVHCVKSHIIYEDYINIDQNYRVLDWDQIGFFGELFDTTSFEDVIRYSGNSCAEYSLLRVDHLGDTICYHFSFQDSLLWLQKDLIGLKLNEAGTIRFRTYFEGIVE